ncbi:MAG: peptide/nickel transport system ATP-binding protein [Halieaceae bacterium]
MGDHVKVDSLQVRVTDKQGDEKIIVNDVSFTVPKGEVLALIGESGSGKTTIALALMGYARPGCTISGGSIQLG